MLSRLIVATVLAIVTGVPVEAGQATGTLQGLVVAARDDGAGNDSILLTVPSAVADRAIDGVRLDVSSRVADRASAGLLPDGWTLTPGRGELSLAGPPAVGSQFFLRIFLRDQRAPDRLGLKLFSAGRLVHDRTHGVERLPRIPAAPPAGDTVDVPGQVSPGETIEFTVRDTSWLSTPGLAGRWFVAGAPAGEDAQAGAGAAGADPPAAPGKPSITYRVDVPLRMDLGARLSVAYRTRWDETVFVLGAGDAPELVAPPATEPDVPWILSCTPKAFAGSTICVCGWFPEDGSRQSLTLDGQPLGPATAASNRTVRVRLPGDVKPGPHVIAGDGIAGSADVVVVQIGGKLDQEKLWRGDTTPIHLWVVGTDEPLRLTLRNTTPEIIRLEGGEEQVITTSGGQENAWEGKVKGIKVGSFNLTYSLELGSCPCNEGELLTAAGEIVSETPFDDTFRSFRRARELADGAAHGGPAGGGPHDLAQAALEELERTRQRLKAGIAAWDAGDPMGVGPTTAATFTEYIERLETQARTVLARPVPAPSEPDSDDPRDTPPPTIYGEEIDPPWIKVVDGWFAPSQGVWQDDDYFADKPTKQLTRLGPTSWQAELDMVANRSTLLFGIRDDGHNRMKMSGETTYTTLVPVKFRFKLIQGGNETVIWEQDKAENQVRLDGPAGEVAPWAASLMAWEGLPEFRSFTMQPGPYRLEMELVRENGDPTGLKITLDGRVVSTSLPPVTFVPVTLDGTPAADLTDRARDLATSSEHFLQRVFPLPRNSVTTSVQPVQDLSAEQPGALRRLVSLLPGTDTSEQVRRDRLIATIAQRFGTGASLTGGGRAVVLLDREDFALTYRTPAQAYAPSQKVVVVRSNSWHTTVAHELIHTTPHPWADGEMVAECGLNYHNEADAGYGNGVELYELIRFVRRGIPAIMAPAGLTKWITQCSYWHLLTQLQGGIDPELYLVRGFVARRDGRHYGVLAPAYELEDVGELEPGEIPAGGWGIVYRDAAGGVVASYPFRVVWRLPHTEEDRVIVPFTYRVPRRPGVARIELVGPEGRLDALTVSAAAPTVEIVSPARGGRVDPAPGRVTVEWRGSDPDGDALTYAVFFSPDGGTTWRLVADELRETRFDLPIIGRPAGPRVRILATDGVRSATAEIPFTLVR